MLNWSYQCVRDVLINNDAEVSAAEAHGILAGMLCVADRIDGEHWLDAVFGEGKETLHEGERALLLDLCEETRRRLAENDFSFELLLPDDDVSLSERAHALSEWCQGFLYGLGPDAGGSDWPGDCGEVLCDLRDIAQLDSNVSGEADEQAYMEISEFVRVGVQLIRGEFERQQQSLRLH